MQGLIILQESEEVESSACKRVDFQKYRMRILHIDETFHPAYGYQANPLAKFQQMQGHEVYIATPTKEYLYPVYKDFGDDGSGLEEQDKQYMNSTGVKIVRVPAKGYVMGRLNYGKEIFDVVDHIMPDVLFVHCVETITAMKFLLKRQKYPMMFDSHMLSMASHNKFAKIYEIVYRNVFSRIIKRNHYYVIRTQDDDYVNRHLGIPEELTPFISFGTDTMLFAPSEEARNLFREEHGISQDEFVVVYTGKISKNKGGKLLAEAFREKFDLPITLVCVGRPLDDEYGREVQKIFDASENRIIMFPTQNYLNLPQFYQAADLSVFPKQCSMSFYDAQSCGVPVLSEDNNINVDRCGHQNGDNFVAGSIENFREKILKFAMMDKEELRKYRLNSRAFIEEGYDYSSIARKYTEYLFKSINRE